MKRTSFWTYFTSAYGTFWLVILVVALIGNTHVNAGDFGLFCFPILALIYAFIRVSNDTNSQQDDINILSPNLKKFLLEHPEFINAPMDLREKAFLNWMLKDTQSR